MLLPCTSPFKRLQIELHNKSKKIRKKKIRGKKFFFFFFFKLKKNAYRYIYKIVFDVIAICTCIQYFRASIYGPGRNACKCELRKTLLIHGISHPIQVLSVREVVPGRSNNEIILVLTYYDYSVEDAIQAYLEGKYQ